MKYLCISILICFFLLACRYNKVSMVVKNTSETTYKRLTVRFGDTLQIFKDLPEGERTRRFWANKNPGRGFTKIILPNMDSVVYRPQDLGTKDFHYWGKFLVKIYLGKTPDERDTILIKTRRRFLF